MEGTDRALPAYPPKLSEAARKMLERLGVTVRTGAMVTDVREHGVTMRVGDHSEKFPRERCCGLQECWLRRSGAILSKEAGAKLDKAGRVIVEPDMTHRGPSGNFRHRRSREFQPPNRQTASRESRSPRFRKGITWRS